MPASKPLNFVRLQNDLDSTGIDSACIAFPLRRAAFSRRSREAAIRNRMPIGVQAGLMIWLATAPAVALATQLKPEAAQGFDRYAQLTEARMRHEVAPRGDFLRVDSLPEPRRSQEYARLRSGETVAERLHTSEVSGEIRMPGAMIHHWVGTIFIRGAKLADVLGIVEDYDRHAEYYKPDVMRSRILEHSGNDYKVFYRLRREKIVTVILDTEYNVHHHALDSTRAYSESISTRIAQVEHVGEPGESRLPPGQDDGFLWRLNSYWRYAEADRGVYVQCEAISLTRDIPAGAGWLVAPFVESVPKESLEFTLESTRAAVFRRASHANR
jgi:hypothetical protein